MINLQQEFIDFIDNKNYDWVIVRHLLNEKCFCISNENNLADPECPNCEGARYVFTEYVTRCKVFFTSKLVAHEQDSEPGITYKNLIVIYFSANELNDEIFASDYIFELKTDLNGEPIEPLVREGHWLVTDVYKMNMEDGQREFIKVYAKPTVQ